MVDFFVKESINVSANLYAFYFRDIECYLIGLCILLADF